MDKKVKEYIDDRIATERAARADQIQKGLGAIGNRVEALTAQLEAVARKQAAADKPAKK